MSLPELTIRIYGDPCLRKKCVPLKEVGPGVRAVLQSMIQTMHQSKGIGLAAPQVGITERFFVLDVGDGPMVIVNPRITKRSVAMESLEEGCLSIPEVNIAVRRPAKITVQYMDENNRMMKLTCDGLLARVIQHETDHLNGKLIVDYATAAEKERFREKLKALEARQKDL
jgi:peptide deformylase